MPILSDYARGKKLQFFLPFLRRDDRILEAGSGSGWLGARLKGLGFCGYTSLDRHPPADLVGDIRHWDRLGLRAASFDVIIAFELVEHGDFYPVFHHLLRPEGLLLVTTPCPAADPFLAVLERLRLNQRRTSPHTHLHRLRDVPRFEPVRLRTIAGLAQWGVLSKA